MQITTQQVSALRAKTGLPLMEVKQALIEASGDEGKAVVILRKKGLSKSEKRAGKETANGLIDSYLHNGRVGVLVEVLCETDFVAKNTDFKNFAHELSLQIAATNPKYISSDEISSEDLKKEKEIYAAEAKSSSKPQNVIEKIVAGKLETYFSEVCLLSQPYFREPKKKISDLLNGIVIKTGEKIVISRFVRFELNC